MGFGANLAYAQRAVKYTSARMTIGASNKAEDLFSSFGRSFTCTIYVQNTDIEDMDKLTELSKISLPLHIVTRATHAESNGCGNCGEQSAIAFVYLFNQEKIKQIDLMHRTNVDHAFVVIGREKDSQLDKYKTWGDKAVICDPWANDWYACHDIPNRMHGGGTFSPALDHRVD